MTAPISAPWLNDPALIAVFDALEQAGGQVRVNGGAVRNTLLGEPVSDIDLSTDLHPPDVMAALEAAGLKGVPTGIDHGTVTAVSSGIGFEITTLREDVETDGRRAVVRYAQDWTSDALRRDLTMNALYLDRDGTVFDPLNGIEDVRAKRVRFVGEAEARIREDYLRILRFFRFFAWYGHGRPDSEGLKASTRCKDGLDDLSAERVWAELSKLLAAPDPSRALLWMRTTGILTKILPESEKWGIDAIHSLVASETAFDWAPDPLLRLEAIIPPRATHVSALTARLKTAKIVRDRLTAWADVGGAAHLGSPAKIRAALYRHGKHPASVIDHLKLAASKADEAQEDWIALVTMAEAFVPPVLPISGKDLIALGIAPGEALGKVLKRAEEAWIASDFTLDRDALLAQVRDA
ncbi:MAG: CCA tRNA nucleotidyltransferase [Pseudomonadota bacterium]